MYFFGHAEEKLAPYVKLELSINFAQAATLELSPDHYIHVCPFDRERSCDLENSVLVYASEVAVGNYVWSCGVEGNASVPTCEVAQVVAKSLVPRLGLYNPFTLSGNIVVNGVLASAHSSWFLDGVLASEKLRHLRPVLPSVYQTILLPGRWLYGIFGSRAADWLGVNNPQWAEGASQWPAVLAVFGPIVSVLLCGIKFFGKQIFTRKSGA